MRKTSLFTCLVFVGFAVVKVSNVWAQEARIAILPFENTAKLERVAIDYVHNAVRGAVAKAVAEQGVA